MQHQIYLSVLKLILFTSCALIMAEANAFAESDGGDSGAGAGRAVSVEASGAKCVFTDLLPDEACPLFSSARALEFLDIGEDAVIFIEASETIVAKTAVKAPVGSAADVAKNRTSVVASSKVEDAVLLDEIDEDEGLLLEREIQELSGARYELPTSRRELKKQLGFPENAEVASEDWSQMLRVHAETVLSISATASHFLLEQAGVVAAASNPVVVETH